MAELEILESGFLTTVQDPFGRRGYAHLGVPTSGAMDWYALAAANLLVGNDWNAAGLEWFGQAPRLRADQFIMSAVAGRGFSVQVGNKSFPMWQSVPLKACEELTITSLEDAAWGCLAVSGGVYIPLVMGSRSTCLRAGFGGWKGRVLQSGDRLPLEKIINPFMISTSIRTLPANCQTDYTLGTPLRVIAGPEKGLLGEQTWLQFLKTIWGIKAQSDRMGYKLEGNTLAAIKETEIVSSGVLPGVVQLPPNGLPLVLMPDAQTTGGYARIATVINADLPRLAQSLPGQDRVRFASVTPDEAVEVLRSMISHLVDTVASL